MDKGYTNRGFAVSGQYNEQINDLRYQEENKRRAMAEAESKAKLFADDISFQNAMNPYDNQRAKTFAQGKTKEIGQFIRSNPDWQTNIDKRATLNSMVREIKDNPILLRGMASDQAFKELNADLADVAKNPQLYDTDAYEQLLQQKNNYLKHGNQYGEEGARSQGEQAFTYKKPQNFVADLPGELMKEGSNINDFDVVEGDVPGEFWTKPKEDQVNSLKQSVYERHKRQIDKYTSERGIVDDKGKDQWVSDQIRAGFKKHYSAGDVNALWNREMQRANLNVRKLEAEGRLAKATKGQGSNYTPFDNFVDPRIPAGKVTPDLLRKVYGDKPEITVYGNSNEKADLSGFDFNYDGRYVKRKGIPMLLGHVDIPLQTALDKGIISKKGMFEDDDLPNGGTRNFKLTSGYLGKAVIETRVDDKGKEYDVVKVSHQIPVNPNDQTARQMYNTHADVDKHVPASTDPYQQQQPAQKQSAPAGAQQDDAGNVFDESGNYIGKLEDFQ